MSHFFPLRCFLSAFFIFGCLLAFCAFAWLCFCAFWCFLCFLVLICAFWCLFVLSQKNNKKFKTALITSFILLLNCPKSQAKITCVKRKLHAPCTSSIAIPEQKIDGVKYARIRVSLTRIFLYTGKYEWEITRILAYFTPWLAS